MNEPVKKDDKKIKLDWYQTENQVIVTILVRGVKNEDVKVETQEHTLSVTAKLPNGSDYSLELDLGHEIVPDKTKKKVDSSKIEIFLKKAKDLRWTSLEGNPKETKKIQPIPPEIVAASGSSLKTAKRGPRDWDKVVKELEPQDGKEDEEGDAALNALFRKIYSEGSDEVRRAMNKSFQESGGTVLSTNWRDVSKDKVEVNPPEGMEWKKWD